MSDDKATLLQWLKTNAVSVDMNSYPDMVNVKKIGDNLFANTSSSVEKFTIREGVTTIGRSAFSNSNIQVDFANSIIEIGNSAFSNNTSLTSVSLPVATTIGESAFSGNTSLTSVSLPSATTIGEYAFESSSIKELNIGSKIKSIGNSIVSWVLSSDVVVITIEALIPPKIGIQPPTVKFRVPNASLEAYKTAWVGIINEQNITGF